MRAWGSSSTRRGKVHVLGKCKGRSHRTLRAVRLLRILIVKGHANLFVPGIINISMYFVRINLCREIKLVFTYTLNNYN